MTLPDLRTAARPFVSRALRGGRGRRLAGLTLLLALLSSVSGVWLALGSGDFEREIREALDLEVNRYRRERIEFVVIAESSGEAAEIRHALANEHDRASVDWTGEADYRARAAVEEGAQSLYMAAYSDAPRGVEGLRQDAMGAWRRWAQTHDTSQITHTGPQPTYFNWYDEEALRGLRAVIDSGVVPKVEVYASPLGPVDAFRLAGAIAGGVLVILLMLAAPVLAGTQMAQETHENTLQPLAGSALRSTELALGLTAGPLAVAALLAAPQLLLLFAAAATVGHLGSALALVAVAATGGAFLVMLAQLAGLALGKLRSPGLVGGGLAAVLGLLGGVGLVFAGELRESAVGVLALLPQAAASHALAQTFDLGRGGIGFGAPIDTTVPVTIGALGMIAFAVLGMRALARRIGQTTLSALGAWEALVGATVAMLLVSCANPPRHYNHDPFYLINLGLLIVPFAILLMMRAPLGDLPANLRRTPVGRLVGEFAGWAGLYLAGSALLFGTTSLHVLTSPVAALYLAWFVVVAALLSLRIAAAPMTFASRVWAALCAVAVMVAFAQSGMWARSLDDLAFRSPPLFVLSELSPVLGALQAILLVVIPWTLLRALTRPAPTPA